VIASRREECCASGVVDADNATVGLEAIAEAVARWSVVLGPPIPSARPPPALGLSVKISWVV
jgi:hypothetical protein